MGAARVAAAASRARARTPASRRRRHRGWLVAAALLVAYGCASSTPGEGGGERDAGRDGSVGSGASAVPDASADARDAAPPTAAADAALDGGDGHAPVDAGTDASPPDVQLDAGFDAGGTDAAPQQVVDAGPADTGVDADLGCLSVADCDDENPCTDDSCDASLGCVHVDNAAGCDDGNACTTSDTCVSGQCVGGPAPTCYDANACTDDACAPSVGCVFIANTDACDDGDPCTTGDVCASGTCTAGAPSCDDAGTDDAGVDGGLDTSGFLQGCRLGGARWGTAEQSGPCSSIITIYGVGITLGPYGASMEYNVGAAFNTGNGVGDFAICPVFLASFGADPVGSADLMNTHDLDFGLFTVFHPGVMPEGVRFPLISWGNGTCTMPEGYGALLRYVASHGYIVVAPNSVQVGSGDQQVAAIDFMLAENADPGSKYYQHVDVDRIGAMGHSQGGMGTVAAAADARIQSVILWNGGTSASKPFLAVSGDRDVGGTLSTMASTVQGAPYPGAWLWYHQIPANVNGSTTGSLAPGHLTVQMEPERVMEVAVAWWDMRLRDDAAASQMFLGASCTLCSGTALPSLWPPPTSGSLSTPTVEYGHNSLLQ